MAFTLTHPDQVVLLDLDGTLTKSEEGILAAARYAYKCAGKSIPDPETLQTFVGPALVESFSKYGFSQDELPQAVADYRRAYMGQPMFDDPLHPGEKIPSMYLNQVYAGIVPSLRQLRSQRYPLVIATAKPEPQALDICRYFGLMDEVDALFGASMDMSRLHKADVIRYAFSSLGFDAGLGDRALIIGDRWTDIDGGHEVGIKAIGVRWGYAPAGELEAHGADLIIDRVFQIPAAVGQVFSGFSAD